MKRASIALSSSIDKHERFLATLPTLIAIEVQLFINIYFNVCTFAKPCKGLPTRFTLNLDGPK